MILGAGVLKSLDILDAGTTGTPLDKLAIGFAVSFAVGWAALALLIRFVKRGKLAVFAWYLVPLGAAVLAWRLISAGS